jgi:signal transduction histidine kinase
MDMEHPMKRNLLVVDDDLETLDYLRTVLNAEGYGVVGASTLAGARAELENHRFQMVLTDLQLGEGTGLDVLEAARNADPLTVGIVLSGHGTVDNALQALRQGAYDYLVKPAAAEVLLAAVARGLQHYDLHQSLIEKTAQLEKLENQLLDKSRLIQNVSHELKNPLSVVFGYSSFLLKTPPTKDSDLKRGLQSIHNNAERLGHLLEDLLESSRLATKKVTLELKPMAAGALLKECAEYHRFESDKRKLNLSVDAGNAAKIKISADPRRVHQILANLVGNSMKFTPAGGSITLSCRKTEGFVEFAVKDTGVGITPAHLPHLFERFYQVEMTKRHNQGMGLGLDITRGLVELHGGRIWAESAVGHGTTMRFTLPVHAAVDTAKA